MADAVLKITAALEGVSGKCIDRVFMVLHGGDRYQLVLVFTDATFYEFYGVGTITGARAIDRGDVARVRAFLGGTDAEIFEIGGAAP